MSFSFNYNNALPYYKSVGTTFDISATLINPPANTVTFSCEQLFPPNVVLNSTTGNIYTTAVLSYESLLELTPYTIKATYNISQTVTAILNLGIFIPPGFAYVNTPYLLTLNSPTIIIPTYDVYNFEGTVYSLVSPSLPPGLNLNTSTGDISGTPTITSYYTTYTVRATYNTIVRETSLSISVNTIPIISYPQTTYTLQQGVFASINSIIPAGEQYDFITINCDLPIGLFFNAEDGSITGTPLIPHAFIVYTITISNTIGSSTATIAIGVIKDPLSSRGESDNTPSGLSLSDPQIAMRLKAETLKHNGNNAKLTQAQKWSQTVNNRISTRLFNPLICTTNPVVCSPSSASNVPGPMVTLCYDPTVPLISYNQPTRVRTNIGQKWPQRSWKPGDNGFPVGKAGSGR